MLKINKQTITLTKGDDASLRLVPRYKDRTEYVLTEGDRAVFRIKFGHTLVELDCTLNLETNKIVANITPNDTKDFNPGIYRYEAELITSYGFHYTFIADQTFILGQEYEQRTTSTSNGNSSAIGGNLPEIDGVVDGEPVVYGDIQPTNPMMDYDELNHLPKLNGKTIKGDKDNEYYGIPTKTSDLENDSDFVSDDDYVHTDNNYDDTDKGKVDALGTASTKNVPSEGNASPTEVVMGSDTRLSDSRPASDVYDWAKAATKPSYSYSEISNTPTLGTAAAKNFTNTVASGSTDLVESGAVKTAIDSALSSAYKHGGTKTVEELTSALLIEANQGYVYNITNDGVTTADFIEGAGKPIRAGDNVGVAKVGNVYKFDLLSGFIDTSNFVEKSSTSGLIKNDGTIDTTAYAKQNEMSVSASGDRTTIQLKSGTSAEVLNAHQDISGKANKSEMFITDGTGANADKTTIQLKDGLSKAVLIAHQDISGKAEKSEMSVTDGTGTDADKTTIQLKSGTSATVLKTHQDISGKADKVLGATNGNLAGLDANGNLTDSGIATTDVEEMQDELSIDTSTIEGNPINFSTLSAQNAVSTIIDLEPIQDLHGYDYPWVGGAGKNLLPMTVDGIKTANGGASTWTGNKKTIQGIEYEIIVDNDNNVIGIKGVGKAIATSFFNVSPAVNLTIGESYTINAEGYIKLNVKNIVPSTFPYTFIAENNQEALTIRIPIDVTVNTIFHPIMCKTTETSYTFAPYTNICPITGRTQVGILGCGKNLFNKNGNLTTEYYFNVNTGELSYNADYSTTDYIPVEGSSVKVSGNTYGYISYSVGMGAFDKNKNLIRTSNVTTMDISDAFYIRLSVHNNDLNSFQVEIGNSASTYEPYHQSNSLTISLGQTVYGCTLDVEKGQLSILYKTKSGKIGGVNTDYSNLDYGMVGKADDSADKGNYDYHDTISSMFAFENASGDWNNANKIGKAYMGANLAYYWFGFPKGTTLEDMQTITNDNVICYELATPITIQLTPNEISLLKGVNNISVDDSNATITLTYRDGSVATLADVKALGDEMSQEIADSQILTDTVTGDKYKLVVTSGVLSIEQISN